MSLAAGAYAIWKRREPAPYRLGNAFGSSDLEIANEEAQVVPFDGDLPVESREELEEDPDFPGVAALQAAEDEEVEVYVSPRKFCLILIICMYVCMYVIF